MASYQPPIDTTAIFNSQSFLANNYNGESDPNKLDFPNAQGVPTMPSVNVSDGINSSLITPTGITNSGAYSFNTTSSRPIVITNPNTIISNTSAITTGSNNIVLGINAFAGATGSVQCVAIGNSALNKTIASNATAVGHGALSKTTVNNTALGSIAGGNLTSGGSNVCIGFSSLSNATTSNNNVAVGYSAGNSVSETYTHSNCCFIGGGSDSDDTAGHTYSVALGAGSIITGSNQVVLGRSSETVVVPSGLIKTGTTTLTVNQTPQLNTANTFTTTQTYNGINIHNQNLSMAAGFGYNLVNRNFMGIYTSIAPASFNGTASISGTTMTTTASNPQIVIGTAIFGAGVTDGTVVTAVASSTSFTVNNSQTSTPTSFLSIGTTNIVQIATINNGTGGISGNIMTLTSQFLGLTLPIGAAIFGSGVTAGTRVIGITSPTVYTLSVSSMINSTINGTFTIEGSNNLGYSLSEIYYITPSPFSSYSVALPPIATGNIGATTTLRITNTSTSGVSVTSVSPIFVGTSSSPTNTHAIYANGTSVTFASTGTNASISGTTLTLTGTPPTLTIGTLITGGTTLADTLITAIGGGNTYTINRSQSATPTNYTPPNPVLLTHTFMALPTSLGTGGFGWFQLGTV
jgi:hypothetical protein